MLCQPTFLIAENIIVHQFAARQIHGITSL